MAATAKAVSGVGNGAEGARSPARTAALILATALVYFAAAKFGLGLAFVAAQVTVVWPPTGIALAALLLLGPRLWPGVLLGAFAANATTNEPALVAAAIAIGNTLEAIVGARILRSLEFHTALDRVSDVLDLILGAALTSTLVSATIGVTALCAGGVQPWSSYWSLWWVWWLGDAIGDVLVGAPLLVWATPLARRQIRRRPAELAALLVMTVSVTAFLFAVLPAVGFQGLPLHYVVFPLVVWAALRHGQLGTTATIAAASGIAIWSTVNDLGPFAMSTAHESLIMVQLFMGTVATTGLILAGVVMERDATNAQRATDYAALEVSEETLRLALQAARLGVWDWSLDTGVVHWRESLTPIHGLPRGVVTGTPGLLRDLAHPEDRDRIESTLRRSIDQAESCAIEFRSRREDGGAQWLALHAKVSRSADGRPVRMIGTVMDITERRGLEAELRQRVQQLDAADRRKDEFLAMLAHELRNPLAPLSVSLQLLGMETEKREHFLRMAERQVNHLVLLVNDLLDVSRISHGKITLNKTPTLLSEIIDRAVELTRAAIDNRGHTLVISLPATPVGLDADPARMAQAIGNLLANAAKFTPAGGSIAITAETTPDGLELRVRDNGVGIAPELLPDIFDLFVQGNPSLDRTGGGLGIGLTLVRHLVELHGGRVEAHSAGVGEGTEMIVRLPTLPLGSTLPLALPATPAAGTAARGLRILVVEDNQDAAAALAGILELWGHTVRVTFDGAAALAAMESFDPEVIVSDLGLPGMDGYELARGLRREETGRRAVLIALSGYGRDSDKRRSLEAGFDYHQVKPIDLAWFDELLARIAVA